MSIAVFYVSLNKLKQTGCRWFEIIWCICDFTQNTLRPRQDGRHFADDIFKWVFLNEDLWISINVSLKFVPKDPINNIPALVQIMAWRRPGDKPLSGPMILGLLTHICVPRPQWVKPLKLARCPWHTLCGNRQCVQIALKPSINGCHFVDDICKIFFCMKIVKHVFWIKLSH